MIKNIRQNIKNDCFGTSCIVAGTLTTCLDFVSGGNSSISTKWRKELLPEHCVSSVEVFDPVEQTWSFGPELPNALCGAGKDL